MHGITSLPAMTPLTRRGHGPLPSLMLNPIRWLSTQVAMRRRDFIKALRWGGRGFVVARRRYALSGTDGRVSR
jgi:hypothetical protein